MVGEEEHDGVAFALDGDARAERREGGGGCGVRVGERDCVIEQVHDLPLLLFHDFLLLVMRPRLRAARRRFS